MYIRNFQYAIRKRNNAHMSHNRVLNQMMHKPIQEILNPSNLNWIRNFCNIKL